jgi:hypothetical protein
MYRLNRGLELESAGATATRRFGKMAFRLFDQWQRPLLAILLRKRNVPAVRPSSLAVEHQSQQAPNLRLPGHELQKDPREPDRLLGQIPAALVNAGHVIPADPEGGI